MKVAKSEVIGLVIEQILEDFRSEDVDGIYAMLTNLSRKNLIEFLPPATVEFLGEKQ